MMVRKDLLTWLQANAEIVQGYWLDGDWPSNPEDGYAKAAMRPMCRKHVDRAARLIAHLRRDDVVYIGELWASVDSDEECHVCHVPLDSGGLTDCGIDNVLAIGEPDFDADEPRSTGGAYLLAARSMLDADPRWSIWERQVSTLMAESAASTEEIAVPPLPLYEA